MLFDLRSRGRRRAVQVIYLGLAVLMLGGLVLFGVGAGNNNGGLLNAFTNSGSSGGQSAAVNAQTKAALKQTRLHPSSAAAWSNLVVARYTAAGEGSNYDSAADTYTASGKKQLKAASNAWNRYLQLTDDKPTITVATLMARSYGSLEEYANEASAWEYVADLSPSASTGYICLAGSAYAAKETRKGELAAAKALTLVPKLDQLEIKQELTAAKTSATLAQECGASG